MSKPLQRLWEELPNVMLKDQWPLKNKLRQLQKRSRQGKLADKDYETLVERIHRSVQERELRLQSRPDIVYPENLPIIEFRSTITEAIQQHQVVIVAGETGSGKTTQLPKMCLEAGRGVAAKIGCTQPRRIAATSISRQIAKELNTEVGQTIGYKIRFSEQTSPHTLVQMMTDGILLMEIQQDRYLNAYDTIIIDEAHERSLNIDFLIGYLRQLLPKRPDLKVILSSANLDIPRFADAFNHAPIIEVSGRMYPVDVFYRPIDEDLEEEGEVTMEDAVVSSIREILDSTWQGNILAFLPGEHEIREVTGRLRSHKQHVDVMPLFGRLSASEQNRIFQNTDRRKVIVATNIAETSLTIPGIRYVIDSGLARISRYSNRSRTQRLPVEPISRSSANQRKGRAGRVQEGVCIRLYAEDAFESRKEHTEPEILRSSLSGVILKMKSLKFGDIEEFPFIDPPSSGAIREGLKELRELGALDDHQKLTPLGWDMSRLPIEPRTARMLLAARKEKALREVLVISAGISIQDPREFPLEKKEQAKQMHSLFVNRESDFITLLNIWDRYHEEWENLRSENKMRKFCKKHFLSFNRMREWRDIYNQLKMILKDLKGFELNVKQAEYRPIHVSILSGYLSQIGVKKQKNVYQMAGNKEATIFPGSGFHNRGTQWMVSSELVETSRLFARMAAHIEPDWLEPLGKSLCRRSYSEAHFDSESGSVTAYERVTLYGLTIVPKRRVYFGRINPAEATALFIREGLVDGQLRTHHKFFLHNRDLQKRITEIGAKVRRSYEYEIEAAMQDYYTERLYNICSAHDLNGLIKRKINEGETEFLFMKEEDLVPEPLNVPADQEYPDYWQVGSEQLPLKYQLNPDPEQDGVTLQVPESMLPYVQPEALDWLVPGHWEEKIYHLLKSLPKRLRKQLVPLPDRSREIVSLIQHSDSHFLDALQDVIRDHYGVMINRSDWDPERIPEHLRMKVAVIDYNKNVVASGRQIFEVLQQGQQQFQQKQAKAQTTLQLPEWDEAARRWHLKNLKGWTFDTLPRRIEVTVSNGIPLYGFPGLKADEQGVHRMLFRTRSEAEMETREGMSQLLALSLGPDVAWLERDFRDLRNFEQLYFPFGSVQQLKEQARLCLFAYLFAVPWIETQEKFEKFLYQSKAKINGLWPQFLKRLEAILLQYAETRTDIQKYLDTPSLRSQYTELHLHLSELVSSDFVKNTPYERWPRLPRYLKAMSIRAERITYHLEKDQEKSEILLPYLEERDHLSQQSDLTPEQRNHLSEFRWMLEEFRISLFAPEIKTAMPISEKRLDKQLGRITTKTEGS